MFAPHTSQAVLGLEVGPHEGRRLAGLCEASRRAVEEVRSARAKVRSARAKVRMPAPINPLWGYTRRAGDLPVALGRAWGA